MTDESLTIYRRHMPHWRKGDSVYLVTWRVHAKQHELTEPERAIVADAIKHFAGSHYRLSAFVVMNDHVHVLVQPLDSWKLQEIVQAWKSYTANRLQKECRRIGAVWQGEYFDRIMRDEKEFWEKANYILGNPAKRWPEVEGYRWVWMAQE